MIKLYHVPGTRSMRPLWLCHELNMPLEVVVIDFSASFRSTPEWRAISPAGKVPAMTDGDMTMFESGAMVDYILERYGSGRLQPPSGTEDSAHFRQWCWFSEATMTRPVGLNRLLRSKGASADDVRRDAEDKAHACLNVVERAVDGKAFLVGDAFSAADIMMGYSLHMLSKQTKGLLDERYPALTTYRENLEKREAFKKTMASNDAS